MSENLVIAYHLSSCNPPVADSQGLFKVLSAEFVFNHWQSGQIYLHQVCYSQAAIREHCEDGHHDGISSFSWDEFVTVDNLTSRQFWQLDNRDSLFALLKSEFMNDLRASIFSSRDALHQAVLTVAGVELAVDYIRHAQLSVQDLYNCLTVDHCELVKALLALGGFTEEAFCRTTLVDINWKKLTKEKDSFMGDTLEGLLGLSEPVVLLLRNIYSDSAPKTATLSAVMVALSLINELPWRHYIRPAQRVVLPCALLLTLLRLKQDSSINAIFDHPDIEIYYDADENSNDLLIDRLAVYQHFDLLKLLQTKSAGFDKQQSLRCASSLTALGTSQLQVATCSCIEEQELRDWQLQISGHLLADAASHGYLFLCEQLLSNQTISQMELDSALLVAAEQGYSEIVKLLHQHGGSLEAGGRWPIRYANKFSYPRLKTYLLGQGQEDLHF